MYSSNDPLNNLSPEQRQRVEDALRALGGGALQGMAPVFVTQLTDAPLQQAQSNQAWAHWEYGAHEWALFDKVDWRSRRRTFWLLVGGSIVFILATILSVLATLNTSPEQVTFIFATLLVIVFSMFGLGFFIFTVVYLAPYREARKRHKARQNQAQPNRVTISQKGVWEAGTYFPLNDDGLTVYLKEVKMTSGPLVLHFRIALGRRSITSSPDGTYSPTSPQTTTLRVLVPRGHETEAAQLMQRFRTEVTGEQRKGYNPAPREPN
jgi:uncharacterized integral membrane protein